MTRRATGVVTGADTGTGTGTGTGAAAGTGTGADEIVRAVLARPATLGTGGRLVCVDGPAGSGKTTLGAALERRFRDALGAADAATALAQVRLLHMDDLYDGWSGLETGRGQLASSVLEPLRSGRPGHYRRYDWHRLAYAEDLVVEPCEVLVVEGVGSTNPVHDDVTTCRVWVEAPPEIRTGRGLARDGERLREHWLAWQEQEDALFAREGTRERADVVVDGTR